MTILEGIVIALSTRDLAPRAKGTSRAAIKSWLVENKHAKESPLLNASIRNALKKGIAEGLVLADGPQRFRLDLKKRDALLKKKKKTAKVAAAKKKKRTASKKRTTKKRKSTTRKRKAASKTKRKSASKKRVTKKSKKRSTKKKN